MIFTILSGCLSVREEDLNSWVNRPVLDLELHPFLITMPVVKTKASDGTEIWNYVNGGNIGSCTGFGSATFNGKSGYLDYANYSQFSNCMQRFAACNNIFYIKDGRVLSYNPVGTGGARCYTNAKLQPGFRGPANIF